MPPEGEVKGQEGAESQNEGRLGNRGGRGSGAGSGAINSHPLRSGVPGGAGVTDHNPRLTSLVIINLHGKAFLKMLS